MTINWTPKLSIDKYNRIKEGEWFEFVDFRAAKGHYKRSINDCKIAVAEYNKIERPLRILAVHGSGRSTNDSCAYEMSNSKIFLQECLKVIPEIDSNIEIDEVSLREIDINPCNNCVSTTSSLCGFPCDCFPLDQMHEMYPKILRSDILLCSTGVNQSTMSTRLKAFCDRMISLDGGFFRTEWNPKDGEFKDKMLALSATTDIAYDQRLYGRVGGYFISSKDQLNKHPTINRIDHERRAGKSKYDPSFAELTAYTLRDGMEAYGYFHPAKYYAVAAADPDIDYMYDKETMMNNTKAFEDGREVIKQTIELAKELKENLPEFQTDRFNRT